MYQETTFVLPPPIPRWKRALDILGATVLIVLTVPIMLLVALLIKIESRGPVFYISKRVGQGYRIFNFYKFRSMQSDADARLKSLHEQNQYALPSGEDVMPDETQCADCAALLFSDHGYVEERQYRSAKHQSQHAFFKAQEDPRITRMGRFIRSTSIDELPQLFNVLKGDMSLVGNRPLPLYEAECLTTDQDIARFLAPAGITGLWQVTKRGRVRMSEEERKRLDVDYALSCNFWMDCKILALTLPAAVQQAQA